MSDYTEEEIQRKISIHSSIANLNQMENQLHLSIPRHSDFIGEVMELKVCEVPQLLR